MIDAVECLDAKTAGQRLATEIEDQPARAPQPLQGHAILPACLLPADPLLDALSVTLHRGRASPYLVAGQDESDVVLKVGEGQVH
jgi:hypothetical protein